MTKGYTIKERPKDEKRLIITDDPNQTVGYVLDGSIQFARITELLDLGTEKILPFQQTLTYQNPSESFEVQVRDTRSYKTMPKKRGDFTINVALTKSFQTGDGQLLRQAKLYYQGREIDALGVPVVISQQQEIEKDKKEFHFLLDQKEGKEKGFSLEVPAGAAEAKSYQAEMTWELVEGP